MSIPNLIPHKTLYISGYIYSYYAFVFIFEFPEHISKHILQFHAFFLYKPFLLRLWKANHRSNEKVFRFISIYYADWSIYKCSRSKFCNSR